ncbi:MAG: DUF4129 domain-containing protein [Thermomicrobia bacterium]|nr:DUF4129 domain-containing protein [Thermomicrobia bacterium]
MPVTVRAADVDLPTYLQRVTTARDALMQAQALAGAPRDAAIQRAQDALDGIDGVTVDGTRYPAPPSDALAALRRAPPDTARALIALTTLRTALADAQAAAPDPQARQKLDRVLSDRAFRMAEPNIVQKEAIRFQSWLREQVRRLFRPLSRVQPQPAPANTPGAGPMARLLALLGSPLVLLIFVLVLAALLAFFVARRRRKRVHAPADETVPLPQTAAQWRQHAEMLAAAGDYRAAIRALFLGTLTDLDERRLVAFEPSLTDREYLRAAQRQQTWLAEPLRPFVRLVESIVYAAAPCDAAAYARAWGFTDDVRRIIEGSRAVRA